MLYNITAQRVWSKAGWVGTRQLPAFSVHASSAREAASKALDITGSDGVVFAMDHNGNEPSVTLYGERAKVILEESQ